MHESLSEEIYFFGFPYFCFYLLKMFASGKKMLACLNYIRKILTFNRISKQNLITIMIINLLLFTFHLKFDFVKIVAALLNHHANYFSVYLTEKIYWIMPFWNSINSWPPKFFHSLHTALDFVQFYFVICCCCLVHLIKIHKRTI